MTSKETIKRLEKAIFDFKECTEYDERSSVIQSLIEDLTEEPESPEFEEAGESVLREERELVINRIKEQENDNTTN
jgi:hypothetical protein